MGTFVFPEWDQLTSWFPNCERRDLWNNVNLPVLFVAHEDHSPYIFRFDDDGSAMALSLQEAMAAVDAFACRELAHAPVPALDEIFSGQVFSDGSVADIIHKAGGFNFLADLHRQKRLFSIRDDDLPTSSSISPTVNKAFADCLSDLMELADIYENVNPIAYALIQALAHLLPHFLYARGPRTSDILECVKHFRAGRWQRLWNDRTKNASKLRAKRARRVSQPRPRSDGAKDTYAQKCAK
jgi:hypothetical protein